jgi:hypothetical protein
MYRLFIMMDANFRLMNRAHKNDYQALRLSPGWAYYVDLEIFEKFLTTYIHPEDVRKYLWVTARYSP